MPVSKVKKTKTNRVKYVIFNLLLLCCFFVFGAIGVKAATIDTESSVTIYGSNHKGDNTGSGALGYGTYVNDGADDLQYVQVTGGDNVDTIAFRLETTLTGLTTNSALNGVVVTESGYTGSGAAGYDSYVKDAYGVWTSEIIENTTAKGLVVTGSCAFDVTSAKSTNLKANDSKSARLSPCIHRWEDLPKCPFRLIVQ